MHSRILQCLLWALSIVSTALAVADTDTYRDADTLQNSYSDNHNMDPAVVDSAEFGLLWQIPFNSKEQVRIAISITFNNHLYRGKMLYASTFALIHQKPQSTCRLRKRFAEPLYISIISAHYQHVFDSSSKLVTRTLDAKTGELINSRQVATPFLQSDIGCTDIPNYIGIIGTPVIDPDTEIAYFYAKTYIPNYRTAGNTGVLNGVYYIYAVDVNTLEDVDGYPVLVDGSVADNDDRKYFIGGTILQRPSLLQVGNYIYAGFGGHCDLFNYTGTVLGFDITQRKVITNFAVESGPNSRFSTDWDVNGAGGQGGIWMSGMGLASDGDRLFFATGNGQGGENQGTPASGQSGCRTLGETVTNLGIDTSTGKLALVDYFQPYDYVNMDGGDQDFGSGGVSLLDPTVFTGGGVRQIAITTGKNGKIYFMNADNLGGYKQGPGQTDLVLQTIVTEEAVFGGVGSYPLEGGYIYSTPVGYPTSVYKLGFTSAGVPNFNFVGKTPESSAGRVGPGVPTITTYKGQAGTAIMWTTDPDAGLRAWYAVPQADQTLKRISIPQIGGSNKFQRPVFGDTRLYTTDANGVLYCLGSPVNLPMNCSSPVDFGTVALGSKSAPATVECTAIIGINGLTSATVSDNHFEIDTSTLPKGAIAKGTSFFFNVTWDLTNTTVTNAVNASYGNTSPGIKSAALTLVTDNSVAGYTTSFPISLTGNEVSDKAFLQVVPQTVDFGGLMTGVVHGRVVGPTYSNGSAIYDYLGCYEDNAAGFRLLPHEVYTDVANNTNEECQTACLKAGYTFAGTEYAQEKYTVTNDTYDTGSTTTPSGPVTANSSGPYQYIGCYSEATTGRALSGLTVATPDDGGSVEYCESQCAAGKYTYFGVEYANEDPVNVNFNLDCWCGTNDNGYCDTHTHWTGLTTDGRCDMVCAGNSSVICGGPNGLTLYILNTTAVSSSSTTVSTTRTGTATTTTASATPTGPQPVQSVGNYAYIGCYSDNVNGRALPNEPLAGDTVTAQSCAAACTGYTYFGLEPEWADDVQSYGRGIFVVSCFYFNFIHRFVLIGVIFNILDGATFQIECGIDHSGGDMGMVYVNTFEACINACDNTTGCVDVSLSGQACYEKKTLGAAVGNAGILGAKLVVGAVVKVGGTSSGATSMASPVFVNNSVSCQQLHELIIVCIESVVLRCKLYRVLGNNLVHLFRSNLHLHFVDNSSKRDFKPNSELHCQHNQQRRQYQHRQCQYLDLIGHTVIHDNLKPINHLQHSNHHHLNNPLILIQHNDQIHNIDHNPHSHCPRAVRQFPLEQKRESDCLEL
ncbi:hypothetical protein M8818_004068 [Zalaria obscura]|uniref:Uncharacterized protein n=1 Tax=Zalaria obscura TaxID=2024903 RepID=A0ACC3SES2_9PEZI